MQYLVLLYQFYFWINYAELLPRYFILLGCGVASARIDGTWFYPAVHHLENNSLFYGFILLSLDFWSLLFFEAAHQLLGTTYFLFAIASPCCKCWYFLDILRHEWKLLLLCSGDVRSVLFNCLILGLASNLNVGFWWSLLFWIIEGWSLSLSFRLKEESLWRMEELHK